MSAQPAYECARCHSEAVMREGQVLRSCDCSAPVLANMSATVYGQGHASTSTGAMRLLRAMQRIGAAVLRGRV